MIRELKELKSDTDFNINSFFKRKAWCKHFDKR